MKNFKVFSLFASLFLIFGMVTTGCFQTNHDSATSNDSSISNSNDDTSTSTHEHTYSSSYEYDDVYHWHPSICGHNTQGEKTRHTFEKKVTNPTYENGGYTTYTCSVCGYSYKSNEKDKLTHNYSSEWNYDSSTHWHACVDDGYENLKKDESSHTFIEKITDPTYESGGYTTYTCSTCGYSYKDDEKDKLTHNYSSEWNYDSSTHWHVCVDDGYENLKKDESSHTFIEKVTVPTYESGGYTTYTCSTCGYSYTDNETDALPITITWKNYDGTILEVDNNVPYGSMPSYDGKTPTKSSDFLNKYSFIGWSPEITSALSNTEYMAVFEKIKLTSFVISYEAFGGQNVPSSQTKEKGLETSISDLIPAKTGYIFLGWNNKYEDKIYQPGDIFSLDGNVTLYAMWAEICDACNGSANDVSEEDCSYCTNGKVSYWYCSYCQKETYVTVIMGLGPVCNTCHKKAQEKSKTCSYCNGKGYVTHINDCSSCDGRGYILPNAPILLTCEPRYVELQYIEGYEYSIDGINWQGSNEFRNLTPNTTYNFYQRRKTDNELPFGIASDKLTITTPFDDTYYIYYELDGGVNNVNNPVEYNADSGKLTLFAPTKEHFEFAGWSLNGEIIESINTSLHTDIVLAAVWLPKQYTATFESNDGTFEKCTINLFYSENTEECVSYELEYGDKFNLNSVKIPEKDNYIFSGWFLDKDYSDEVKGTITIVSNINIYAKMVPVSLFTSEAIDNIASNGAYLFSMSESTYSYSSTISYSSKFIVDAYTNSLNLRIQAYPKGTITIYDLTADRQIFWCTIDNSDFNNTINVTPFHIYEISLNSRGTWTGTGDFGNLYHHSIVCHINCIELSKTDLIVDYLNYAKYVYGQKITLPKLERNGYKFLGWFDENNEPIHDVYDYETDMTFHAEWEKLN